MIQVHKKWHQTEMSFPPAYSEQAHASCCWCQFLFDEDLTRIFLYLLCNIFNACLKYFAQTSNGGAFLGLFCTDGTTTAYPIEGTVMNHCCTGCTADWKLWLIQSLKCRYRNFEFISGLLTVTQFIKLFKSSRQVPKVTTHADNALWLQCGY